MCRYTTYLILEKYGKEESREEIWTQLVECILLNLTQEKGSI